LIQWHRGELNIHGTWLSFFTVKPGVVFADSPFSMADRIVDGF